MAHVAISAKTVLISGTVTDTGNTADAADTITITAPTGQTLDLDKLVIRLRTSGESATTLVIGVSSTYSSKGIGTYSFSIGTNQTIYVGGKEFESARFLKTSAQSVVITQGSACTVICEAAQLPNGFTA